MYKKTNTVVALVALLFVTWGGQSQATLLGLPKSLKDPLAGFDKTMPSWGPMAYDFSCIQHLAECQVKKVSLFSSPKALKPQLDRLPLDTPALGPMAHSMFCVQYPKDCEVRRIAFRGGKYALTPQRWNDLAEVNAKVNRSIKPERNTLGVAGEKWLLSPASGDCNDYAVTKRHELLDRGWPSRTLLLAEVVTSWGEHHLVLLVRTAAGDFVLDSLNPTIRPWSKSSYQWVRVQSPRNPKWWSTVRSINA